MAEPPLRYVVLRHEGIEKPHFDLMFETAPGSALATWRSADWPLKLGTPLEHLPDHRPSYLTYEGELSGGRGFVSRVASGRHIVIDDHTVCLQVRLEEGTQLTLYRGQPSVAYVFPPAQ